MCEVIFEKITKTRAVDKILTADIKKSLKSFHIQPLNLRQQTKSEILETSVIGN
jgi:hypothetical protein